MGAEFRAAVPLALATTRPSGHVTTMSGTPSRPPLPTPSRAPREPVLGALPAGGLAGESLEARRTLVVGRGIVLQGSVQDAECVVVEGTVESRIIYAQELSVLQGGVLKGEVEVEDAELAGVMDGTLTSRRSLVVRAGGRMLGTARCRRLRVEDGGEIIGRVEMLPDQTSQELPHTADTAVTP